MYMSDFFKQCINSILIDGITVKDTDYNYNVHV